MYRFLCTPFIPITFECEVNVLYMKPNLLTQLLVIYVSTFLLGK